ncbi:MAG TPA: hypothetical protein VGO92_07425 [Acidimicrobiales bacterium]|jgi:hypothetical protein|nr:hypothetical protein [Acidimicrobiales bacterium]
MHLVKRAALTTIAASSGLLGFGGAFQSAHAGPPVCTPTPTTAKVCAGADPSVGAFTVDSAESATIWVLGNPNAICIGRVTIAPFSGTPVTYDPDVVYVCY